MHDDSISESLLFQEDKTRTKDRDVGIEIIKKHYIEDTKRWSGGPSNSGAIGVGDERKSRYGLRVQPACQWTYLLRAIEPTTVASTSHGTGMRSFISGTNACQLWFHDSAM